MRTVHGIKAWLVAQFSEEQTIRDGMSHIILLFCNLLNCMLGFFDSGFLQCSGFWRLWHATSHTCSVLEKNYTTVYSGSALKEMDSQVLVCHTTQDIYDTFVLVSLYAINDVYGRIEMCAAKYHCHRILECLVQTE